MRFQRSELALLGVAVVCALVVGPGAAASAATVDRPPDGASHREKNDTTRSSTTTRRATDNDDKAAKTAKGGKTAKDGKDAKGSKDDKAGKAGRATPGTDDRDRSDGAGRPAGAVDTAAAKAGRSGRDTGADDDDKTGTPGAKAGRRDGASAAAPAPSGGPSGGPSVAATAGPSPTASGGAGIAAAGMSLVSAYNPSTASVGETVQWTTTLTLNDGATYNGVSFALYLPTGVVADAPTGSSACGATLTRSGGTLYVNGASLSPSATTCVYTMPVHATAPGTYVASTGIANNWNIPQYSLNSTLTATPANATLTGGFSAATVVAGSPATLDLELNRSDTSDAKSGLAFTVALPTGVTVGSGATTSDCGGTVTATAGQGSVALAGGALGIGTAGCAISVPLAFTGSGVRTLTGESAVTGLTNVTSGITTSSIEVFPAVRDAQTITFAQPLDVASTTSSVQVDPTASSDLPVALTSTTTAVCTVEPVETAGRTVQILKPGLCTLSAAQAGNGYFEPATAVVRTFAVTPPMPTGVLAVAGSSSIAVSWTAPTTVTGITGYRAIASPGPAACTTTGALSCVLGAEAGKTYTVTVVALAGDAQSPAAGPSQAVSPVAPVAPAVPPATNLTLTTDRGGISATVPGAAITFVGTGFAPHSTVVITMYSAPRTLGTDVTDAGGAFSTTITVPTDLAAGRHTALAQGVAPDGSIRSMAIALTVRSSAPSAAAAASLPVTGAGVLMLVLAGCALALTGTGLVYTGRPRRG